jgi:hypothetical protein
LEGAESEQALLQRRVLELEGKLTDLELYTASDQGVVMQSLEVRRAGGWMHGVPGITGALSSWTVNPFEGSHCKLSPPPRLPKPVCCVLTCNLICLALWLNDCEWLR